MKTLVTLACALAFTALPGLRAENGFQKEFSKNAFANLDKRFVEIYSGNNALLGRTVYPLLVVDGFKYTMYMGAEKIEVFNGLRTPFNELKAVSHVGPALYSIGLIAWNEPHSDAWRNMLKEYTEKLKVALQAVDAIDWSNAAWPGKEQELATFMNDSLQMALNFAESILKKDSFTKEDFQGFAQHYLHTMLSTMYLATLGNTTAALKQLNQWKETLGPQKWNDLYVVVTGTTGRTMAGATVDTNTSAYTIASLMDKGKAETNLFIFSSSSQDEVLATLGTILNARELAHTVFTTENIKNAPTAEGIYKGLENPRTNLAMEEIKHIVDAAVLNQKNYMPSMTMFKQDLDYLKKLEQE